MKKLIAVLCLAIAAIGAQAVVTHYKATLVITKKSGEKVEYKFAENPVATFEGSDMTITADGGIKVVYPAADVQNMSFTKEENWEGVDKVETGSRVAFAIEADRINVFGLTEGAGVNVFGIDGRLAGSAKAGADGSLSIEISHLPSGVYVVAASGTTFKFIK